MVCEECSQAGFGLIHPGDVLMTTEQKLQMQIYLHETLPIAIYLVGRGGTIYNLYTGGMCVVHSNYPAEYQSPILILGHWAQQALTLPDEPDKASFGAAMAYPPRDAKTLLKLEKADLEILASLLDDYLKGW